MKTIANRNKYHARGFRRHGEYYHSQAEADYESVLELLLMAGEIESYLHHPPKVKLLNGAETWQPDFMVTKASSADLIEYYVEVKGYPTPDFKKKFNFYKKEAEKHLPLFTVKQNKGNKMSFSILEEYCINPAGIKMA